MKPQANLNIAKDHAVHLKGGDVQPLSKLAAPNGAKRDERFAFTSEDRDLLEKLVSGDDFDE